MLSMNEPSTATLVMNKSEGTITVGQFVELYDTWGSIGFYRVNGAETTYTPGLWDRILRAVGLKQASISATLKHAICTLEDAIIFGYHEYGGTGVSLRNVLVALMALQEHVYWQIGTVDFDTEFAYSFENEKSLLAAILSTADPLTAEHIWTFDFTTTPWTLNLLAASSEICEMRMNRNAETVKVDVDRTELVNRIYPLGYGEGVNQLTIADVNGGVKYLEDSASQATWGIVSLPYAETTITDAATLKGLGQAQLDARKEPKVTVSVTGSDLSALTGESLDRLLPGRMCRVPLPDYNTTVNERVISISKADVYKNNTKAMVTLANRQADSVSSMAENARKASIAELYSQGAPNQQPLQFADNADADNPAVLSFYMDEDAVHINKAICRYRLEAFRGYSKGSASGGASAVTSSNGGETELPVTVHITDNVTGPPIDPITFYTKRNTDASDAATTGSGGAVNTGSSSISSTVNGGADTNTGEASGNTASATAGHYHTIGSHQHLNTTGTYTGATSPSCSISDDTSHSHTLNSHTHTTGAHNHPMSHTHIGGAHVHAIPTHTHGMDHYHVLNINVSIPALQLGNHTHTVSVPSHTHANELGIYKGTTATSVTITVDGNAVPSGSIVDGEFDAIPYLDKDVDGKITRGAWHDIEITPNQNTRIVANLHVKTFVRSISGGNY